MTLSSHEPQAVHIEFMRRYRLLFAECAAELPPMELLALASQVVGQMLAYQDPALHTLDEYMDLIGRNIEEGNQRAVTTARNLPTKGTC